MGFRIAACAVLAGCAAVGGTSRDGRYVGEVTPRPSVPGARCGGPARGLLDLQGTSFTLAPSQGVLVIPGELARDGTLHGGLTLHGASAGGVPGEDVPGGPRAAAPRATSPAAPQRLVFDGRLDGDRVTGTVTGPRCVSEVALQRP